MFSDYLKNFKSKRTAKSKRKTSLFVTCIVISVFMWLIFSLSNKFVYSSQSKVVFVNQPVDRAVDIKDSIPVTLTIESSGWLYLFKRFNPTVLEADLSAVEDKNIISLQEYLRDFNETIKSKQKIVKIVPDTVYFTQVARVEKKIPVILNADITYAHQYTNAGNVSVIPDSVLVSGPLNELKSINSIETLPIQLNDLSSPVQLTLKLDRKQNANIHVSNDEVLLNIPVEEFTENTVEVPVSVNNNANNLDVNLIPNKVKVTYHIPLSRYNQVRANDFKLAVDLNEWKKENQSMLQVEMQRFPDFIKVVRIEPEFLNFLIYQ